MVGVAVGVCAVSGRGHRAAHKPAPTPAVPKVAIPLPEWAPKNPSSEFLRAARVIRPWPEEPTPARDHEDLVGKARSALYRRTMPAAWEFFGTLSDEQIKRIQSAKRLRLMLKDLTPKQRTALYHYFDVSRETMKGVPDTDAEFGDDVLVELYKLGATKDLSNVQIEFLVREGSHILAMFLRAQQRDGTLSPPCPAGLGFM
jgi:hypothetical protein